VAYETGLLKWLELRTVDLRFQVRGKQAAPKGVAVVAIDDVTFNERPNDRWPFKRRLYAQATDILKHAGAKGIGYDIQFTDAHDPTDDGLLYDSIWRARNARA